MLARSVNENGLDFTDNAGRQSNSAESVWAYDYGKGRVCFMAPGHMITVLWNPEYKKMQKNAVQLAAAPDLAARARELQAHRRRS